MTKQAKPISGSPSPVQERNSHGPDLDALRAITASAAILHDLRSPIGTICAGAEMLMELDGAPTHVKRLAANMSRAAGRIRQLLADFTDTVRGDLPAAEPCDIREIIASAADAVSAATGIQGVQIELDFPEPVSLRLMRSRMERVFFNLIANAFESMPGGGRIYISGRRTGPYALIELEDTGPGVPLCIRHRLFEPFVTVGKQDGLGLGLALARQTVREHGGDIWIEPAAGARFVIRLPLWC